MKQVSVLGQYSAIVAATVIVGVIAAAILARVTGNADSFLDGLALAAFGLVAGTAGSLTQLNGTVKRTAEQDDEILQLRADVAEMKRNQ